MPALSVLRTTKTMREVILKTLPLKGDTDSVCAIALGITGASRWNDLPSFIEHVLEPKNTLYGAKYLKDLGRVLMKRYQQL